MKKLKIFCTLALITSLVMSNLRAQAYSPENVHKDLDYDLKSKDYFNKILQEQYDECFEYMIETLKYHKDFNIKYLLRTANERVQAKQYTQAIYLYSKTLKEPTTPIIKRYLYHLNALMLASHINDYDGALTSINNSIKSENIQVYKERDELYIYGHTGIYTGPSTRYIEYATIFQNRGIIKYLLNKKKEAINDFDKSLKVRYIESPHGEHGYEIYFSYLLRAYAELAQNNYKEALVYLNKIPRESTHHIYKERAYIRTVLQDYNGALADYNRLIYLYSKSPYKLHYNRGVLKTILNDYKGALCDINASIKRYNDTIQTDNNKAQVYTKAIKMKKNVEQKLSSQGINYSIINRNFNEALVLADTFDNYMSKYKYREALQSINLAISKAPDYKYFYRKRYSLLNITRGYTDANAYTDCEKSIVTHDDDYYAFALRGELRFNALNLKQDGMNDINKAIALNPNDWSLYVIKGKWLQQEKQYNKAIKYFDKAIQLYPNDNYNILELCYDQVAVSKVIPYAKGNLRLIKQSIPYYSKIKCLEALEHNHQALAEYDKLCLKNMDENTPVQLPIYIQERGRLKMKMGDYDGAVKDFNLAYKKFRKQDCIAQDTKDLIKEAKRLRKENNKSWWW